MRSITIVTIALLGALTSARIGNCPIDPPAQTLGDCESLSYGVKVATFALPGILVGALLLLCCPFYACTKYCCDCCGGRNQSPNYCCPDPEYPARYASGDILRPKILAVAGVAVTVGFFIYAAAGVDQFKGGVSQAMVDFENVPNLLQREMDEMDRTLTVSLWDAITQQTSSRNLYIEFGLRDEAESIKATLSGNINGIAQNFQYFDQFNIVAAAIFVVPLGAMVVALICAFFNIRTYIPMLCLWVLMLFGAASWLGHAFYSAGYLLVTDFCTELKALQALKVNLVPVVLMCQSSMFASFFNAYQSTHAEFARGACMQLLQTCYDTSKSVAQNIQDGTVFTCPTRLPSCTGVYYDEVQTLYNDYFMIHPSVLASPSAVSSNSVCRTATNPCHISTCASDCANAAGTKSMAGKLAFQAATTITATHQVSMSSDSVGSRFRDCHIVMYTLMRPIANSCWNLEEGMKNARLASGMESIVIVGMVFVCAYGAKRFLPDDEANLPQLDEWENNPENQDAEQK